MVADRDANPGTASLVPPGIRITVRDGAAESLYGSMVPAPQTILAPGASVSFASRLDTPPAQGRDLAAGLAAGRVARSGGLAKEAR